MARSRYPILLVAAGALLWGTDSLFRRPLASSLSPITIVTFEHAILALVVLPILVAGRPRLRSLGGRDWMTVAFIAVAGSVAATSLFTYAIKLGNPSVAVLLQKTQPLFTIALARPLLGERPPRRFWYCLLPALAGACLLSAPARPMRPALGLDRPVALAAAVGAAALWGSCTAFGRLAVARIPPPTLTSLRLLLGLPPLALLYVLQPHADRVLPAAGNLLLLFGMALVPGLAALLLYYRGLESTGASAAAIGELAFPVTAVLANWLLLDVRLSSAQLFGGALLVASITALGALDLGTGAPEPGSGPVPGALQE